MKNSDINNIYKLDGKVPVSKAIPFGLQALETIIIGAIFATNIAKICCRPNGIAFETGTFPSNL